MSSFRALHDRWYFCGFFCIRVVAFEAVANTEQHFSYPNVCVFAKTQQQGTIEFASSVVLKSITFTHKSGRVRCCADPCPYTNFGCNDAIGVVMTKQDGHEVVLPTADMRGVTGATADGGGAAFSKAGSWWYKVDGASADSPRLHWSIDGTSTLNAGKYDIWYNEALTTSTIDDNDGHACYDIDVVGILCEDHGIWNTSLRSCAKHQQKSTTTSFEWLAFAAVLVFALLCLCCYVCLRKQDLASKGDNTLHSPLVVKSSEPEWVDPLRTQIAQIQQAIGARDGRSSEPEWLDPLRTQIDWFRQAIVSRNESPEPQWLHTLLSRLEKIFDKSSPEAVGNLRNANSCICEEDGSSASISSAMSFILVGPMASPSKCITIPSSSPSETGQTSEAYQEEAKCFLPRTYFLTYSSMGSRMICVPIEELKLNMLVCDAYGGFTKVQSKRVQTHEKCETVQLTVGNNIPTLTTTTSHRIVTELKGRSSKTVPAGDLQVGHTICCNAGEQILQQVKKTLERNVDIYEIAFKPDLPVRAFDEMLPEKTIASKGKKLTRRGRKDGFGPECASMPETEFSWATYSPRSEK